MASWFPSEVRTNSLTAEAERASTGQKQGRLRDGLVSGRDTGGAAE